MHCLPLPPLIITLLLIPLQLLPQSYDLNYSFTEGKDFRYKKTEKTSAFKQTQTGLSTDLNKTVETFFSIRPQAKSDRITFLYLQDTALVEDRSTSRSYLSDAPDLSNVLTKKPVRITMSTKGELHAAEPQTPLTAGMNLPPGLSDAVFARTAMVFPLLPKKDLHVGMKWTESVGDTSRPQQNAPHLGGVGNGVRYFTSSTAFHVTGKERKLGQDCVRIEWKTEAFMEMKMIFPKSETFVEEKTSVSGEMFFNPQRGVLVHLTTDSQKEGTTAIFSDETAILPSTSTVQTTIQLQPD